MGLGSGIRNKSIPDPGPGAKKAPIPYPRSATLVYTGTTERNFYIEYRVCPVV
jgi:hypothetical protein